MEICNIINNLKSIKKQYGNEFTSEQQETIEYVLQQYIDKLDACVFDQNTKCSILKSKECQNCKFRKSKAQYIVAQKQSEERLKRVKLDKIIIHSII